MRARVALVLAAVVAAGIRGAIPAAALAASPPTVSPEFAPSRPDYVADHDTALSHATAGGEGVYLVVWEAGECRCDYDGPELFAIRAARVSRAGVVLDPVGITVASGLTPDGSVHFPSATWTGTNFVIAWVRGLGGGFGRPTTIEAVRMDRLGNVLDPEPIIVASTALTASPPRLATSDAGTLIVWEDGPRPGLVRGALLTPNGGVVETSWQLSGENATPLGLAWSGSSFLLAWTRLDSIESVRPLWYLFARRLDGTGNLLGADAVIDSGPNAVTGGLRGADVAAHAGIFLVAWARGPLYPDTFDIFGSKLADDGAPQDGVPFKISAATGGQVWPRVVASQDPGSGQFLVVWQDFRDDLEGELDVSRIVAVRVDARPFGGEIPVADNGEVPSVGAVGRHFLVTSPPLRGYGGGVQGARVSGSGAVLDSPGFEIATIAVGQSSPRATFGGDQLVVWLQGSDVYAARVDGAGRPLDAVGFRVSPPCAFACSRFGIAVARGRNGFLVVWTENGSEGSTDVVGVRVGSLGGVLDSAVIPIAAGVVPERKPSVASDGSDFLVVWEDHSSDFADIRAARVGASGAVLDQKGIDVSTAFDDQLRPAVVWNGSSYLLVWEDFRSSVGFDVYGARLTRSGTVADPDGIPISQAAGDGLAPAVASDGTRSLVVWQQGSGGWDVRGARVGSSGLVLDPQGIALSATPSDELTPRVAWNGSNFVVAWEDRGSTGDIRAARVSPSGSVLDVPTIAVAAGPDEESSPDVSLGPVGRAAIAYEREAPEPPYGGVGRVFLRFLDDPPNDDMAAASAISGADGQIGGVNVGATKESGEPNHAGDPGGSSVWYAWRAPASGSVTIDTIGSSFDTVVAVYTGGAVSALNPVVADDNSGENLTSKASFAALEGTAYLFAVDGANGATGSLILKWAKGGALDTAITSGPEGYVSGKSATFEFGSTMQGATFECSLDGGSFSTCLSPKTYASVGELSHTFRVASKTSDGLQDPTPATRTWTVDTTPPTAKFLAPTSGVYVGRDEPILSGGIVVVAVGEVTVEALALDRDSGIVLVKFEIDGVPVSSRVTYDPATQIYRFTYEPRPYVEARTITVRATNGSKIETVAMMKIVAIY